MDSTDPSDHVRNSTQEKKQNSGDVLVLDSEEEEEEEGEVKRELSPSRRERSLGSGFSNTQVIDLTLESDEESVSDGSSEKKRKAEVDPAVQTDEIWKKSRIGDPPNDVTTTRAVNGNVNSPTADVMGLGGPQGARRFVNGVSLPQRAPSHGGQYTAAPHAGSPYTTPYYSQVPTGTFGSQVTTHRTGYYSQFGNG